MCAPRGQGLSKHQECGVIAVSPYFPRYPAPLTQPHRGTPAPQPPCCTPSPGCTPELHTAGSRLTSPIGGPSHSRRPARRRQRSHMPQTPLPPAQPHGQATVPPAVSVSDTISDVQTAGAQCTPYMPCPEGAAPQTPLEGATPSSTHTGGLARPPLPSRSPRPGVHPHGTGVTPDDTRHR